MASNKSSTSAKSNFDTMDKMFSNTLKRNPKMELSKTDLLKLLSYLEGELQAREIVIATLKAERVKQLLYQAKYGQFSLNDPFAALQRDSYGAYNPNCDEAAIKAMYNNQLSQVENLILQHQRAQQRLRQHLFDAEQQHAKVVAELEDEIRKHAQDTAQGDDVTYMLEKERERLHQEIELERQQNKKLEKELKKVVQALEQDKVRHKQIVVLLLEDRKRIVARLLDEHGKAEEMARFLTSEKGRMADVVEGLEEESKKSLEMEAELERQAVQFGFEREELKRALQASLEDNRQLHERVSRLTQELADVRQQLQHQTPQHHFHRAEDDDLDDSGLFARMAVVDGGVHHTNDSRPFTNTPFPANSNIISPPAAPPKPAILLTKTTATLQPSPLTSVTGELSPKVIVGRPSKSPSPVPHGGISPQHSSTLIVGGLGPCSAQSPTQSSTIVRTVRSVTPTPPSLASGSSGGVSNHVPTPPEKSAIRSLVTAISGGVSSSPPTPPPPPPQVVQVTPRVSVSASPGTRVYTSTQGGKVTFHVTAAAPPPQPPKKPPQLMAAGAPPQQSPGGVGRGVPPPIPPNKPVLLACAKKDGPPPQQQQPVLQYMPHAPHAAAASAAVVASATASSGGSPVAGVTPLKIAATSMPGCGLKFGITIGGGGKAVGDTAGPSAAGTPLSSHLVLSSSPGGAPTEGGAMVVAATSVPVQPGSSVAPPEHQVPSLQIFKETQQPVYVSAVSPCEPLQPLRGSHPSWDHPPECHSRMQYLNLSPRKSWSASAHVRHTPFPRCRPSATEPQDSAADGLAHELADFQQLLVSMAQSPTGHSTPVTWTGLTSRASSAAAAEDSQGRSGSPTGRLSALLERWKTDRGGSSGTGSTTTTTTTTSSVLNGTGEATGTDRQPLQHGKATTGSDGNDDGGMARRPTEGRTTPVNFTPRVRKVVTPNLPKSFNDIKL